MEKNKLINVREKLLYLKGLLGRNNSHHYYLTVEEKQELVRNGKSIPIRVKGESKIQERRRRKQRNKAQKRFHKNLHL